MTKLETMNNFVTLSDQELVETEGGGILEDTGKFIGGTWKTIYDTGRDFGRSIVNAIMP